MSYTIETADGASAYVERVTAKNIEALEEWDMADDGDALIIENGASHQYVIIGNLANFARNVIDLVPEARTISQTEYSNICDVIDHAKNDDRSEDTDSYASQILAALGLSIEGARA